jgi:hypothetical protein
MTTMIDISEAIDPPFIPSTSLAVVEAAIIGAAEDLSAPAGEVDWLEVVTRLRALGLAHKHLTSPYPLHLGETDVQVIRDAAQAFAAEVTR